MAASIAQLIGKVNLKKFAKNRDDLLKKYGSVSNIPAEEIKENPLSEHKLTYDSATETLEPVYFFIIDLMNDFGLDTKKLIDNFSSSPGSGHFAELGQRATIMQQQAGKIMGDINTVLRSVLNLVYDLKEFKIRLQHYDDLNTDKRDAAILALKQIWLDKVDMNKGNSSIKAMTFSQMGFQTLLDAFLAVKDIKDVGNIDLNERVKRILKPRIMEFNDWLKHSEKELRKRYQLERDYLKSQVNSLKLYSRWAKPYLIAARDLEMKQRGRDPSLVKAFNTLMLELTVLGKDSIDPKEEALIGDLPKEFEKLPVKRDYYYCVLIDFNFRGIPQKVQQQSHYSFGGRADISFKSYVLNEDELAKLEEELDSSDINDVLKLIEGATDESLKQLQEDIDFFLEEDEEERNQSSKTSKDQSNPFKALIGGYDKQNKSSGSKSKPMKKTKKDLAPVKIRKETFLEKEHLRPLAEEKAKEITFKLFDIYKKAHGMPSYT